MRRRLPVVLVLAVLAAWTFVVPSRETGAVEPLSRGVSRAVFRFTTYDSASAVLGSGQGLIVGPRGEAVVAISTLEGAAFAEAVMMDGRVLSVRDVRAADEEAGLVKIRLSRGAPDPGTAMDSSVPPEAGIRVMFGRWAADGQPVCRLGGLESVKEVPDLPGVSLVRTSCPLPEPGTAVFDTGGSLLGVVVMRLGKGAREGILASGARLVALSSQRGRGVKPHRWTAVRAGRWEGSVYARYMKAQAAFRQGRPEEAVQLLEDHTGAPHPMVSRVTALLGEAFLAMDLLPEAILNLNGSIEAGSPPNRVYRNLAWAYMESGRYDEAEEMCLRAIESDPSGAAGFVLLAHLRNLQGEWKQAVYVARRAVHRDPECPSAHFERGKGYLGLARYGSAIRSLKRATSLDRYYCEAFSSLGYAYLRSGKPLNAIVVLKEATRLDPEMEAAWSNLGEAYLMAGLPDRAVPCLRQAVCIDPTRSYEYCRIARVMLDRGRNEEAVKILQLGIGRALESQWLLYYLGKAHYLGGRIDQARHQAELLYSRNRQLGGQLFRIIGETPTS